MTKLPALDKGALPLQQLRDEYIAALGCVLDGVGAQQVTLVLSRRLAALFTHVFVDGLGVLKQHHVVECVALSDDPAHVSAESDAVLYLSLARVGDVRVVAQHAEKLAERPGGNRGLFLYVTGKWTSLCEDTLEACGMRNRFQTGTFSMGFVPLDTDLLTLGYESCLRDCIITGDTSALVDIAAALHLLQQVYGKFTHIKYKGELSMLVLNQLLELNADRPNQPAESTAVSVAADATTTPRSRLDTLVLLDRSVDFASPLSTPLTYEALVDEMLQIQDGFISVSPQILTADDSASDVPVPVALNSSDEVFQQIRDKNVLNVPVVLNAHATSIKQRFEHFQSASATASAAEVHEFVKTVPEMKASQQAVEQHVNLLEHVELTTSGKPFRDLWQLERGIMDQDEGALDAIEDLIFRHEALCKVLRLLCLYCVVNGGLARRDLARMKLHLVRAYGHELTFSFDNLARVGLLYERSGAGGSHLLETIGTSTFQYVSEHLALIDLDVNVKNPKTAAFVTSGYAPISCRLVEEILQHGSWRGLHDVMSRLPGPRAEVHLATADRTGEAKTNGRRNPKKKPVVVVAFVGGVSFLELAALRWLASFYPVELVIAATSVLNGTALVSELLERLPSTIS